ncbi:MAG: hypothetical protein AAFY90_14405 [Pseudomonadota bacterium]
MLLAFVLTTLLETLGFGPQPLVCRFPPPQIGHETIKVVTVERPSLKDIPGLFRVEMEVNDTITLPGAAQPITTTSLRDAMVRAVQNNATFYTLGFDETGAAALNILWAEDASQPTREITRIGRCRNYARHLDRWVS